MREYVGREKGLNQDGSTCYDANWDKNNEGNRQTNVKAIHNFLLRNVCVHSIHMG